MEKIIIAAVAVLGVIILLAVVYTLVRKFRPVKLDQTYYAEKWIVLQKQCRDKSTWPLAVMDADKLLDSVLKKHHYKGKTMGERLVKAQRKLSDNDKVWFGHKLRNRIAHEEDVKLKEADVKQALIGIRQALKDLGALK